MSISSTASCESSGIDGGAAGIVEIGERFFEGGIGFVALLNPFFEFGCEVWDVFSEICDGGLPVIQFGWCVREQELEHLNQVCGFGDVDVHHLCPILVEDGALWVLEENIVEWVACLAFVDDRSGEVVVHILRFPIGEGESDFVENSAVDDDTVAFWSAHRVLRDECAVDLFCAGVEQESERVADCAFVRDVVFVVLLERGVVVSDCFVVGFQVELWHGGIIAGFGRCVKGKFDGCCSSGALFFRAMWFSTQISLLWGWSFWEYGKPKLDGH